MHESAFEIDDNILTKWKQDLIHWKQKLTDLLTL